MLHFTFDGIHSRYYEFSLCWWDAWTRKVCLELVVFGRKLISVG